jgi:TonB family protein
MTRERGSIALYLLFSVAAAGATGYVAYRAIRTHRLESEAAAAVAAANRPPPSRPVAMAEPVPAEDPLPTQAQPEPAREVENAGDVEVIPSGTNQAELDAEDPEDFEDPATDTVVYGTPGVSGGLTPASVERTVKRYGVRIERCLRKTREKYHVRRCTVRVTAEVDAQGKVLVATATRENAEPFLGDCVLDVVRKLRFDAPSDHAGATIVYPIVFAPGTPQTDSGM